MATFLFSEIIFGPVISRRLGVSLGINLLPTGSKVCSFDCIYCECGRTPESYRKKVVLPTRSEVKNRLRQKLVKMGRENRLPDVITFAGNGEPTLHPDFAAIIDDTIDLRDKLSPDARIAVLSNASTLNRPEIFKALLKVDDNIQKLDSAVEKTVKIMDCPGAGFSIEKTVGQLKKFNGKVIIQTMFLKGESGGQKFNNTSDDEINAWLNALKEINPEQVMIYTIARDTPLDTLEKIPEKELNRIAALAEKEGFRAQVSA